VGRLRRQLAERQKRDSETMEDDGEEDEEMVEEEDAAKSDIPNLPALAALLDTSIKELGKDDPSTSALRQRVEAARAAQRASKPAMQQLQGAQRREEKLARQLAAEKATKEDLLKQRDDIDEKIDKSQGRVHELEQEQARVREEIGQLLERTMAEKGCGGSAVAEAGASLEGQPRHPDFAAALASMQAAVTAAADPSKLQAAQQLFSGLQSLLATLQPVAPAAPQSASASSGQGGTADPGGAGGGGAAADAATERAAAAATAAATAATPVQTSRADDDDGDSDDAMDIERREGESNEAYSQRKKEMERKRAARRARRDKEKEKDKPHGKGKHGTAFGAPAGVATKSK
jgi:hypothetical protein